MGALDGHRSILALPLDGVYEDSRGRLRAARLRPADLALTQRQSFVDGLEAIMRERESNSRIALRATAVADEFTQSAS
jgi:hypothetical protein